MILSLFVAFIVTPWSAVKLLKTHSNQDDHAETQKTSRLNQVYQKIMETLLSAKKASFLFGGLTVVLLLISISLIYFKSVKVKMLPFDNKQEFQVLIDYPATTSLTQSQKWSEDLADQILKQDQVESVQVFAGEAAPFSFSGMVKHTFLRKADYQNDLHIVLTEKGKRKVSSHEIIEKLRPLIKKFAEEKMAITKVLEIPPVS